MTCVLNWCERKLNVLFVLVWPCLWRDFKIQEQTSSAVQSCWLELDFNVTVPHQDTLFDAFPMSSWRISICASFLSVLSSASLYSLGTCCHWTFSLVPNLPMLPSVSVCQPTLHYWISATVPTVRCFVPNWIWPDCLALDNPSVKPEHCGPKSIGMYVSFY